MAIPAGMKLAAAAVRALAPRPRMWPAAVRQTLLFAPDRWWRRPPFLPLPSARLKRFRAEAMYGDPSAAPTADDLLRWLRWCEAHHKARPRRQ